MSHTERKIVPAMVPVADGAILAENGAPGRWIPASEARDLFATGQVLVANAPFVTGRLKVASARPVFDILELFAFVHPAEPCVPSAAGVAAALGLARPETDAERAMQIWQAAKKLMTDIAEAPAEAQKEMRILAATLARNWRWSAMIISVLGESRKMHPLAGFDVWKRLPKWEDDAPPGAPSEKPVSEAEAETRLNRLVGNKGEARAEQAAYTRAATAAFAPRAREGAPNIALIEAGTGTGKTLGYLAPASLWAEKNGPGLWISTYTRNLQRQILQDMPRLYPDPKVRATKAVVRKGRENYLCLLNFEEQVKRAIATGGARMNAMAMITRWVSATEDGDISGPGYPAFLSAIVPPREISDRRGECIYAGCPHYRACFIERVVRRARKADIVIANHALVIAHTAQGREADEATGEQGTRLVFDEGHHLFEAADSGFSSAISGLEMAELRRWLRGPEGRASRARGLEERLKDFSAENETMQALIADATRSAADLAGEGFSSRLAAPRNPGEAFLAEVYQQVKAQSQDKDGFYSLECETQPASAPLLTAAEALLISLQGLSATLSKLARTLRKQLDKNAEELEPAQRARLDSHARGLERRAQGLLPAWIGMLEALTTGEISEIFADWFEISREDGRDRDVAMQRHYIDPSQPFSHYVLENAHGALITSATLRDDPGLMQDGDAEETDWQSAELRTGASHLPVPPSRAAFGSPYDYGDQARIFIVRDVNRRDGAQLSAAYRELFLATAGGALGLFTSVRNLKMVAGRIAPALAEAGLPLYAQHIDRLDTGALVDLFRSEENSCLLGTDALRDGVDVPGRSLRLVVFDKVPWPRPTILHKARRAHFGKRYDDLITRLRLKQAFGRLIRSASDKGCFVILESATPTRLITALPADTPVMRCGLAEAIREIRKFLGTDAPTVTESLPEIPQ